MAANGASLQAILEAGEWKSRAVLNYVASEQVDDIAILDATSQQSDAEDAQRENALVDWKAVLKTVGSSALDSF